MLAIYHLSEYFFSITTLLTKGGKMVPPARDFCLQHSLADFRVQFSHFKDHYMKATRSLVEVMKSIEDFLEKNLDTLATFDVCCFPSLRKKTMAVAGTKCVC